MKIQFDLSIRNEFRNIEGFEINCEEINNSSNFIFKVTPYTDIYFDGKVSKRLVFDKEQVFDSLKKATDWIKKYILDGGISLKLGYREFVEQIDLISVFIMNTSIDINNDDLDRIFD